MTTGVRDVSAASGVRHDVRSMRPKRKSKRRRAGLTSHMRTRADVRLMRIGDMAQVRSLSESVRARGAE